MPEQAEPYLRAAAAGEHLSTLAWSERGSRSHFWAPVSQAVAEDGAVALSAEKSWVTAAGQADGYVVSTRSAGAAGADRHDALPGAARRRRALRGRPLGRVWACAATPARRCSSSR